MAPTASLPEPGKLFHTFTSEEPKLRASYLDIERMGAAPLAQTAEKVVKDSAVILELLGTTVCLFEALEDEQIDQRHVTGPQAALLRERVRTMCGLDPVSVLRDAVGRLGMPTAPPVGMPEPTLPTLVYVTRAILAACPIEGLEQMAADHAFETWGHRCRVAYAALQAFVLRNDAREQPRLQLVGRQYAEGVITIAEAATLLTLTVPDTVFQLELHGFHRPIDVITLTPDERQARLARIRADRQARRGWPTLDPDHAARDAIASERIEGVDARRWIRPTIH